MVKSVGRIEADFQAPLLALQINTAREREVGDERTRSLDDVAARVAKGARWGNHERRGVEIASAGVQRQPGVIGTQRCDGSGTVNVAVHGWRKRRSGLRGQT